MAPKIDTGTFKNLEKTLVFTKEQVIASVKSQNAPSIGGAK